MDLSTDGVPISFCWILICLHFQNPHITHLCIDCPFIFFPLPTFQKLSLNYFLLGSRNCGKRIVLSGELIIPTSDLLEAFSRWESFSIFNISFSLHQITRIFWWKLLPFLIALLFTSQSPLFFLCDIISTNVFSFLSLYLPFIDLLYFSTGQITKRAGNHSYAIVADSLFELFWHCLTNYNSNTFVLLIEAELAKHLNLLVIFAIMFHFNLTLRKTLT